MLSADVVYTIESVSRFDEFDAMDGSITDARTQIKKGAVLVEDLIDLPISSVHWSDVSATFFFPKDRSLTLMNRGRGIEFAIDLRRSQPESQDVPMHLKLRDFPGAKVMVWDRGPILEKRVGLTFRGVQVSGGNLFFYVQGIVALMFCSLVVSDGNEKYKLLNWDPAE